MKKNNTKNNFQEFKKDFEEFTKDTSSKLENVKIKLFDYSYFHSPRKILPQRWVERKQLKEKLKSLINQNNTKCGAYLVTGYRGVGKSSIVQELVDDSSLPQKLGLHGKSIIIRILSFTPIVQILSHYLFPNSSASLIIPSIVSLLAYLYLLICLKFDGFFTQFNLKGLGLINIIKNLHNFINNKISRRRYLQSISDTGFVFLCIFFVFLPTYISDCLDSVLWPITLSIGMSFLYWLFLYLIKLKTSLFKNNILKTIKSLIQERKTNRRKVFININFGHDDLKEIDIFRLISFSLRDKLTQKYKSPNVRFRGITYKFIISFFILFLLKNFTFYNILDIDYGTTNISNESVIVSQSTEIIDPNRDDQSFVNNLIHSTRKGIDTLYNDIRTQYNLNPDDFPYKDFFIIFILYFIIQLIANIRGRRKSYKRVLKKINELIEHIEASITSDDQISVLSKTISYKYSKQKHFPIADTREIERRLINLLDLIRELPFLFHRFEIIFIFDELDKLEPKSTVNPGKNIYSAKATGHNPEEIRQRQDSIFKVLSNMKYFLSTAKAKFIFLAGRDMYDAALADVADRNSFLSSIFYDIIYVPSIYSAFKDNNEPHETTEFIETFICQQIMPNNYLKDLPHNLQKYNHFLKSTIDELNENKYKNDKTGRKAIVARQKREKIIFTLYHFIVYLTHLSNGSVKKMISLFEDYLRFSYKKVCILYSKDFIEKGELYLNFSPDDQHLFAMVNYLANPMIIKQNSRGSNLYGDKLLVQTSYIADHILKFHKQAFTNGNLESIPEILDPNRSPELRGFLKETVLGFTKTHLEKVNFNLPNYKFNRLIRLEISYLSKISEQASAAFNFSLDESLSMKRYFENLLEDNPAQNISPNANNSSAAICCILGDLHYYDEQFDEAIRYYSKALEQLKKNDTVSIHHLSFFLKVSLKLSLVFEKRKAFDAAFSIYNQAIEHVKNSMKRIPQQVEFCKLMYQPILAKLYLIEKTSPDGLTLYDIEVANTVFDDIILNIDRTKTTSFRSDFYYKLAILLYWKNPKKTPQNVFFYIIHSINTIFENTDWGKEKISKELLTSECNIKDISNTIESINRKIDKKLEAKEILLREEGIKQLAKCLSFLGDFALSKMEMKNITDKNLSLKIKRAYELAGKISKYNNDDKSYIWNITKILYLYKFIIKNLTQKEINETDEEKIEEIKTIKNDFFDNARLYVQKIIQAAYSMEDNVHKHEIEKLKFIFQDIVLEKQKKSSQSLREKYQKNKPKISFKRATISVELEETLTLHEDLKLCSQPTSEELVNIFNKHANTPYRLGNNSLNQILWLKNSFHLNYEIFNCCFKFPAINEISYTKTITEFNRLFNNSKESNKIFNNLLTKFKIIEKKIDDETLKENPSIKNRIFEYFLFNSIYCGLEMIRLYKSHGDNKLLSHMFMAKTYEYMIFWTSIWNYYQNYFQLRNKPLKSAIKDENQKEHMIYCDYLLENPDMHETYPDFDTFKLKKPKDEKDDKLINIETLLTKALDELKKLKTNKNNPEHTYSVAYLKDLIGEQNINILSHVYYAEEARKYYHYTKDAYTERSEYKKEIQSYYYLNDDFNDNRSLFFIACDRVEIQDIDKKITTLKNLFKSSQFYNPDLYYKTVINND